MVNVEHTQPALLPEREPDRTAEFHQFRFVEVPIHALPESIVGIQPPRDCFGVGEGRLLAIVVLGRLLEIDQVVVMCFLETLAGTLDRALVAAEFADDRALHVDAAQLL